MVQWNDDIDGNHLKIAAHQGSTMRVVAGPGTGKSYALKRRVMRLLQAGVNPERILAVTFTNVAADALKKDLSGLGVVGAESVRAKTLHSLCFEILHREKVLEITGRTPRPLMAFERDFLVEDLMGEFGGKRSVEKLLIAYESAFARRQNEVPGVIVSETDAKFQERLLRWLNLHRAMLIGELIPITYSYLKNNPEAPEFRHYDFILVDEYQDLNKAEQALIDLLARNGELLIVGDEDQSIYSFKHAHPDGIKEFQNTHNPLVDVNLQVCRRCPKHVVRLANELMGYFLGGHPKKLEDYPKNEEGTVYAVQWETADEESKGISRLIKQLTSEPSYGVKPEEILILSPRRKLAYALRDELQNAYSLQSHTFFQEEALDTIKAQKAYALLNYIVAPNDRVALRALLGLPTGLQGTYEKILLKAEELDLTPKAVLEKLRDGLITIPRSEEIIKRFNEIEASRAALFEKPLPEVIALLFNPADPVDIEVLLSVVNTIAITTDTDHLQFFLKLQERIIFPEVTQDEGFIRIMSLHKSKGLTSKVVFVLGCVAGLVPTIKDEGSLIANNQTLELGRLRAEAKRLFFVALTRTTKYLILSSFRSIDFARAMQLNVKFTATRGSQTAQTQASPFFSEVSSHLPRVLTNKEIFAKFDINE